MTISGPKVGGIKGLNHVPNKAKRSHNMPEHSANAANYNDTVELSTSSAQFAHLMQIASNSPDVDYDKISAIKTAISSGEYKVNIDKLAQNMIDFELTELNNEGKQ